MSGALLFGKLPSHGDFLSHGLSGEERGDLDEWLSGELAMARRTLGDRFEAIFDSAPPWRCAWRDGPTWTAGAIAASMDSAGRRFPVVIARKGLPGDAVEDAALACEEAIYQAFEGQPVSRMIELVETDGFAGEGGSPAKDGWWWPGGADSVDVRLDGRRPAGLLLGMLTLTESPI